VESVKCTGKPKNGEGASPAPCRPDNGCLVKAHANVLAAGETRAATAIIHFTFAKKHRYD
jgi:hypothetical protein